MSTVMLDHWGLITCLPYKLQNRKFDFKRKKDRELIDMCWQNFLTSIILWDDIFLDFSSFSYSCSLQSPNLRKTYTKFISTLNSEFDNTRIFNFIKNGSMPLDDGKANSSKRKAFMEEINQQYNDPLMRGLLLSGFDYLMKANYLGYNYLPHPYRTNVLHNSGLFQNNFIRTKYLEILDKKIENYTDEVNKLYGDKVITVDFPVLYKFLHDNAKNPKEELHIALSLRDDKNVIKFRNSMNKIENMLKNGNIYNLDASLKKVNEITDKLTNNIYNKKISFGVSLGLSPSFNIDFDNKDKVKSKLHTTFLYDIADFALKGNVKRKYKYIFDNSINT